VNYLTLSLSVGSNPTSLRTVAQLEEAADLKIINDNMFSIFLNEPKSFVYLLIGKIKQRYSTHVHSHGSAVNGLHDKPGI